MENVEEAELIETEEEEVEEWFHGFGVNDRQAAEIRGGDLHQAVLQETQEEGEEDTLPEEEHFYGFGAEDREAAEYRGEELRQAVTQEEEVEGDFAGLQEIVEMDPENSVVPTRRQSLSPQERRKRKAAAKGRKRN